jgi:hypothetical protein
MIVVKKVVVELIEVQYPFNTKQEPPVKSKFLCAKKNLTPNRNHQSLTKPEPVIHFAPLTMEEPPSKRQRSTTADINNLLSTPWCDLSPEQRLKVSNHFKNANRHLDANLPRLVVPRSIPACVVLPPIPALLPPFSIPDIVHPLIGHIPSTAVVQSTPLQLDALSKGQTEKD